jgi:LVIVD repeat
MKLALRLFVGVVAMMALTAGTASAQFSDPQDRVFKMDKLFDSPKPATHSDFAFWGDHVFSGYYTASTGGLRIFDISNPASPDLIRDFPCNGNQNDPIVWDRNDNGVADLLLLAVDRTMDGTGCSAPVATRVNDQGQTVRFDANPQGWEGVRVFEMSDGSGDYRPGAPFAVIDQVDAEYTDCGAHTITAWTGNVDEGELVVYVSSYPLRPGPTCGQTGSLPGAPLPYQNTNNQYELAEGDDTSPEDPLLRQIQVISVPLDNPEDTEEIAEPKISYPDDPDGVMDWTERGLTGLEPAAVACHDIVVHPDDNIAGGACAEQGQIWEVDPDSGVPMTEDPMAIGDDKFSSGGAGQFPGAVDFFHSVMFDNGMETVNWVDESFGAGCPTMTDWQARPWHSASTQKSGSMFFSDMEGNFQSEFNVGDIRPDSTPGEYCSSHMGMTVTGINRDLLVNAWYTGGVDVIDFSKPTRLKEIAYYDPERLTGTWSAYPYTGPMFESGPGIPVYASDGVEDNANARGMEVYRAMVQKPNKNNRIDHLNPQTMDFPVKK